MSKTAEEMNQETFGRAALIIYEQRNQFEAERDDALRQLAALMKVVDRYLKTGFASDRYAMRDVLTDLNQQRAGILGFDLPDPSWVIKVTMPFGYEFSKNHLWSLNPQGHVFMRGESKAAKEELALRLRNALMQSGREIYQAKLYLDIFVQKPDHKGDAVNVIDLVCDAVTQAVGLDDRWFCIRRLDWEIVKRDPKLVVGITQFETEDHRVCSDCGRILPLSCFWKSKRECEDCRMLSKPLPSPAC